MNVFDLSARIGLDSSDYDRGLNQAESGFSKVANGIKNGIGTIAKVTAAGFTAAAAGVAAISKQAVESYADYEQLVGGVETLFKDSAGKVQEYANEAYRTAGLSANEYMETVTGFSASLLQSLEGDTEKAAEKSNQALIDMSDNANKMGSDMEMIKNAYSGFAKANYTMLDNLKLGYGGTKQEMERLLADAEKFSGIHYDISSYADIIDAIHVIQTEMGITGTTADEAARTISGSLGMMKSSWQNLITGVADDTQNFDKLIDNFVDSVDTVAKNIMPRVEQALNGVGKLVEKLVPNIIERIPEILTNTLPTLTSAVTKLMSTLGNTITANADTLLLSAVNLLDDVFHKIAESPSIGDGLNELVETLSNRIPQIFGYLTSIGIKIAEKIADGVVENTDAILNGISRVFSDIIDSIGVIAPVLIDTGFQILMKIGEGIIEHVPDLIETAIVTLEDFAAYLAENASVMLPKLVQLVGDIAKMLTDPEAIGRLVDVGIDIIMTLTDAIIEALPTLVNALPEVIQNIVTAITDNLPKLLDAGWEIVKALTEALLANTPLLIDVGKQILDSIGTGLMQAIMSINDICGEINETIDARIKEGIGFITTAWKNAGARIKKVLTTFVNVFKTVFKQLTKKLKQYGIDMIVQLAVGIASKIKNVKDAISNIVKAINEKVTETVKAMINKGKSMIQNLVDGIKNKINAVKTAVSDVTKAITDKISETVKAMINHGKNMIQNLVDGIKAKIQAIKDAVSDVKKAITEKFEEIINKAKEWGQNTIGNFVDKLKEKWENIKQKIFDIKDAIANKFTEIVDGAKNWGKQTIAHFVDNVVSKWNDFKEKVENVAGKVSDIFKGLVNNAKNWGIDMVSEFIAGILFKKGDTELAATAIAETIKAILHHTHPDKGPLKNDYTFMPDMMDMFAEGITNNAFKVENALNDVVRDMKDTLLFAPVAATSGNNSGYKGDTVFNITVQSGTIASDYDANRAASIMAERLAALTNQQRKAVGL